MTNHKINSENKKKYIQKNNSEVFSNISSVIFHPENLFKNIYHENKQNKIRQI